MRILGPGVISLRKNGEAIVIERTPSTETFLQVIATLAPEIEASQLAIEAERRLPQPLIEKLEGAGLFSLWLPKELGGPEMSLPNTVKIVEAAARIDGTTGWFVCNGTSSSRFAAYLPLNVAREIFVDSSAIVPGRLGPVGKATPVSGGYLMSGRWNYASGILHSTWVVSGCAVVGEDGTPRRVSGVPEVRTFFVPKSQVEIIDTWDAMGLRGTGSHDYQTHDLFVAEEYSILGLGETTACKSEFYSLPGYVVFPIPLAAVLLGLGRHTLDLFYGLATTKTPWGSSNLLREDANVQQEIGRVEALLRSARSFLMEVCELLELASKETLTMEQRATVRLSSTQVVQAVKEVAQVVHDLAGGSVVYEPLGLSRCIRDILAAAQHIQVHTHNFRAAGRVLLGLDPGTPRF
jgi:alkylation response protein AidB-like acyl-CoA dehydrogenase